MTYLGDWKSWEEQQQHAELAQRVQELEVALARAATWCERAAVSLTYHKHSDELTKAAKDARAILKPKQNAS
jgi:hypothetical protein